MSGQYLLPCFAVADLMPLSKTVAVGIHTTGLIGEIDLLTLT
jgi:hypothetical protein